MKQSYTHRHVIAILRNDAAYLLQQHDHNGDDTFYLLPGGLQIPSSSAYEIIARPDIRPRDAGLIENSPQTWKLVKGNEK